MSSALTGPPPSPGQLQRTGVRFAGYAAVFDRVDSGGDVVRKGAFAETLARKGSVPLLWQHRAGAVIGRIEQVAEDRRGLRVIGALGENDEARRAAALLASGKLDGLSFGYRVGRAERRGGVRELHELELVEVSLVAQPMQRLARVHAVEAA
ncbi:MAG: HK97 family phage prohead protease [Sphingomicrobium sp.]|nr:HK97 family phage prohead protease [Sphingomonadales bacterium]